MTKEIVLSEHMNLEELWDEEQVIAYIMSVTGWNRRRAKRDLDRKIRQGKLPVMMVPSDQ
jgi:hypothetical protein